MKYFVSQESFKCISQTCSELVVIIVYVLFLH